MNPFCLPAPPAPGSLDAALLAALRDEALRLSARRSRCRDVRDARNGIVRVDRVPWGFPHDAPAADAVRAALARLAADGHIVRLTDGHRVTAVRLARWSVPL